MSRFQAREDGCITLIGMAGAGKSTLGPMVAERLGFTHLDTDRLIEAYYGCPLQQVLDAYGLDEFKRIEESLVADLRINHAVISTGGSVIYGPSAVARLKRLGAVVHLRIPREAFLTRVGSAEGRGLAKPAGKSMEELFDERLPLYEAAADHDVDTAAETPDESADNIAAWWRAHLES